MNKKIYALLLGLAISPAVKAIPVDGWVKDSKSGGAINWYGGTVEG